MAQATLECPNSMIFFLETLEKKAWTCTGCPWRNVQAARLNSISCSGNSSCARKSFSLEVQPSRPRLPGHKTPRRPKALRKRIRHKRMNHLSSLMLYYLKFKSFYIYLQKLTMKKIFQQIIITIMIRHASS